MDRRAGVFAIFAVICFSLYPLADRFDGSDGWEVGSHGWAWVPVILGVVYVVLALLSWLDALSRSRLRPRPLGYERDSPPPLSDKD